jgi:hypothetical protein
MSLWSAISLRPSRAPQHCANRLRTPIPEQLSLAEFSGQSVVRERIHALPSGSYMFLTVLAVFLIDHVGAASETSASEPQKIVNWDVAEQRLRTSLGTIKEEVHEATR